MLHVLLKEPYRVLGESMLNVMKIHQNEAKWH